MRFSCDHCGRVYAVSDELSGRTFRMRCKACGEAILVSATGQEDGLGDEPIGPPPAISVLHAVEPAATAPAPAPRPPPPTPPEVNPFVAQPITVARVAAAVDGSLAAASAERMAPVPLPPPAPPAASPVDPAPARAAGSDPVDDLRRSLDEELGEGGDADIEEFQPGQPSPIGRLREPGARAAMGLAGRRPSDGEGAMALATFTEPAVAGVRQAREVARADVGERPVPEPILEFEAASPQAVPRSRRTPLLVGLALALAAGLAVGVVVARRGGASPAGPVRPVAPASAESPAAESPAAEAPAATTVAVADPQPPAAPPQARPEAIADPRPPESAERSAPRKIARARRQEAAATPGGAEGVVPRGGLLGDDAPRAPGGEKERAAVPAVEAAGATARGPAGATAREPAGATAREPAGTTAREPAGTTAREPAPDVPRYVASGFRSPRLAQADCLSENLRLPAHLAAMVSGPVTVKFAVYPDGRVEQLQVMNKLPDPRIGEAVARAVRACEWVPGADADGTPAPLWVVQPVRFAP